MIRWLYAVLMTLAQPLLRRKLYRRGQVEPGYLEAMDERFGHYSNGTEPGKGELAPTSTPWIWVHAVSLGETRAAAVLIAALRQRIPNMHLLLTHGTATGRAEGRALLRAGDVQAWQPWDAPGAVHRFLDHFQPRVGVLLETEIWPALTAACKARGTPLLLVNARLSEKSLRKALQLAWLARPAYSALTAVYAQTQADADRLIQLGASVQGIFGNVKFDAQPDPVLLARGRQWRAGWDAQRVASGSAPKAVVLFASSREGEEALLLQHIAELTAAQRGAVQWLIVPRHPQRFDEVATLVQTQGLGLSRRSQWTAEGLPSAVTHETSAVEIWLGDSLGEMPLYFALSDVALLGGSFLPWGGQNLIEAAACACPVVMGPHTFNFGEAAQNSAMAGAAFRVNDMPAGLTKVVNLLQNKEQLSKAKLAATAFLALHRGATGQTADAIALWTHP
jgi:3-deoxy-D-manno-octulosonic-acid transferase